MRHARIQGFPSSILGEGVDDFEWEANKRPPMTMTRGARIAAIKAAKAERKRKKNTKQDFRVRHARRVIREAVVAVFAD
jgi:hypothetical protein